MSAGEPVALVTGASSGIGAVFARRLAARGYKLILVARRRDRLNQLAAEAGSSEVLAADLTVESDLNRVRERICAEPRLEFLVNNAGFGTLERFADADLEGQDRMHRLHVVAVVHLTHAALRGMVERRKGNIINVSSVAAFLHNPCNVSYGATKAWINSFTEGICVELKSIGSPVRVQALCPGFTYSEFHDAMGVDRSLIPRSLWMTAESVVDASLRGLEHKKLIVVPGWRYRLFVCAQRWLPRPVRHAIALKYGARNRRPVDKVIP
jgi:hypothetical protein